MVYLGGSLVSYIVSLVIFCLSIYCLCISSVNHIIILYFGTVAIYYILLLAKQFED